MYTEAGSLVAPAAVSTAMLPVTGFNVLWFAIAGFTLIGAGLAALRIAPRLHRATK
jgi:LPXTG-motif cell wall-anchored protein